MNKNIFIIPALLIVGGGYFLFERAERAEPPVVTEAPTSETGETTVPWLDAMALIESCKVQMVMQAHSLEVRLTLKDGTKVVTVEPMIDDVFPIVQNASARCGNILIATE